MLTPQAPLADLFGTGNITALNSYFILDLVGSSGAKAVVSGTWVGTINFQGSVDGNRWDPVGSFDGTNGNNVGQTGITTNTIIVFVGIAGLSKIRAIFTSYTSGTATVCFRASNGVSNIFADNLIPANFKTASFPVDGYKTTYGASIPDLTVASTATDIFTITGSTSKTIRITSFSISGTRTTSSAITIILLKRSTANSGGTSTIRTAIPYDSNDSAATATVRAYTANPTTGTLIGNIATDTMFFSNGGGQQQNLRYDFGDRPSKAIVLRGTSEVLAINLNSVSVTGSDFNIYVEWTEE